MNIIVALILAYTTLGTAHAIYIWKDIKRAQVTFERIEERLKRRIHIFNLPEDIDELRELRVAQQDIKDLIEHGPYAFWIVLFTSILHWPWILWEERN